MLGFLAFVNTPSHMSTKSTGDTIFIEILVSLKMATSCDSHKHVIFSRLCIPSHMSVKSPGNTILIEKLVSIKIATAGYSHKHVMFSRLCKYSITHEHQSAQIHKFNRKFPVSSYCHCQWQLQLFIVFTNSALVLGYFYQGILTKGEGSVQLTSLHWPAW
jgi:hypothetical protein